MRRGVHFEGYFEVNEVRSMDGCYKPCEKNYPGTSAGSKGPIETSILRHGPSATHPRAHEVAGFGVGAFGVLSAGCSELCNLAARVQAVSYMAYYDDKTPKEAFDAQRPTNPTLFGG